MIVTSDDIREGNEYTLVKPVLGNSSASYSYALSNITQYDTNDKVIGKVYVKYFDKKIASGTFWFDAVSDGGEKIEIREGRFDIQF